jgi:hypothetical protein
MEKTTITRNSVFVCLTKYLGDQIRKNEMGGACSTCGRQVRFIQRFGGEMGRPEGKRPLGRHRSRWEDNIKRGLQEVGC